MELLEKHFDLAFTAPNGVQKLRELILTFAMQGKLVPQDPNERSAEELIEEINTWKTKMIVEKAFLKSSQLEPLWDTSKLCNLPKSWVWTRIGCICGSIVPNRDKPKSFSGEYPWITLSNFDYKGIKLLSSHSGDGLSKQEVQEYNARIMPKNSVLMSCVGRFGLVAVIDEDVVANQQIHGFVIPEQVSPEYVAYVIKFQKEFLDNIATSTTISYLNKARCESIPFPLPPLAEQRRIVAKITRLMAQCDELEKLRGDRNQKRITVHTAALNRLLTAKESNDFSTAWRFITQHFGELYSVEENVAELRKAILQLAVMGKLVPQDPTDEPASELLRAIEAEKQKLVKEEKIKKTKIVTPIERSDVPFPLPDIWIWARTEALCEVIVDCPHSTPIFTTSGFVCIDTNVFKNGALIPHKIRYVSEETYVERIQRLVPQPGDVVFAREGSVGESVILPEEMNCCLGQRVMLFRLAQYVLPTYFRLALSERSSLSRLLDLHKGIGAKHVNVLDMRNALIPLPPLAEQRRIVAKVDQLMALCDHLDKQIDAATRKQTTLLNAVMASV